MGDSITSSKLTHLRQLAEEAEELRAAKNAAEQANRVKSQFLANMSHEIRTPMNGVLGLTELLLKGSLGGDERKLVETINYSAEKLLVLIDDILDLSRLEEDRLELEELAFDLTAMTMDLLQLLRPQARSKGIALRLHMPDDVPAFLAGDAGRLHQVLLNLLGNAIKFTVEGQVLLKVRVVETHPAASSGDGAEGDVTLGFEVRDTGIGIPPDVRDHIFEAFAQADSSTTRRFGGSGLGLAISQQIVQLMGGEITVDSTVGEGSSFHFEIRFPVAGPDLVEKAESSGTLALVGGRGRRVLVAEDNAVNQMLAVRLLEDLGFVVDVAGDGYEALGKLRQEPFDVVLMDCQMPVLDGYEATRRWRCSEAELGRPRVPVIALTAQAMKGDRERCLAAGMDDYLSKPFRQKELVNVLDRWLDDPD